MNHNPSSGSHARHWTRWAPPAAAAGAGGATLLIWFEEVVTLVTEFIGVLFLPVLASIIYFFNVFVFKSAAPKADDLKK